MNLKSLRDALLPNYLILQIRFCQNTNVVFAKVTAHKIFLLAIFEKWKYAVDTGKSFGALLADLSKAFDCLSQELLFTKPYAYSFSIAALRLIYSYLTNRKYKGNYVIQFLERNCIWGTTIVFGGTINICDHFEVMQMITCDALRNLVALVQFKKHEKHPWRSVDFSNVAG